MIKPELTERAKQITAALNLEGAGIEYGPLHRPNVPKSLFPRVQYVDYAPRSYLLKHYSQNPNVRPELVPETDIVTGGKPITEFVHPASVDYIVAAHVVEHVPDFIGWLESNLSVLRVGGRIGIAFPDRRYCFDMLRQQSLLSDLVAAWLERRTKPSFQHLCDHYFNVARVTPAGIWSGKITHANAERMRDRHTAFAAVKQMFDRSDYVDCHCWKFADHEMIGTLDEVRDITGLPFEVVSFEPTKKNQCEFHLTLAKREPPFNHSPS